MEDAWELVRKIFDMNPDPIAVLDHKGRMIIANTKFSGLLDIAQQEVKGLDPTISVRLKVETDCH